MSISCGWNFVCSHTITQSALARYDSDPFDAAWGSPLLRIFPCCLTGILGIVFVLVFLLSAVIVVVFLIISGLFLGVDDWLVYFVSV